MYILVVAIRHFTFLSILKLVLMLYFVGNLISFFVLNFGEIPSRVIAYFVSDYYAVLRHVVNVFKNIYAMYGELSVFYR